MKRIGVISKIENNKVTVKLDEEVNFIESLRPYLSNKIKMFSVKEKQHIADEIEKLIKSLNHPEVDENNIRFKIHINGIEDWCFADITDNKTAEENGITINP